MDMFYQIEKEMNTLNVVWEKVLARDLQYDDDLWDKICVIRHKLYSARTDLWMLGVQDE